MVFNTLAKKLAKLQRSVRVIYISSYIPRECGIATFTKDLTSAVNVLNPYCLAEIMALDEPEGEKRDYAWEVKYRIHQDNSHSYHAAVDYINQSSAGLINIQHEFGLYGGNCGDFIIPFIKKIKKPIFTTFHTILPNPTEHQKKVVQALAKKSKAVIVMIKIAAERLNSDYGVPKNKIIVIPHGVPDIPYGPTHFHKEKLGYSKNTIISTFGLINPGKGIEYVIGALPEVIKKFPEIKYTILGATHPNLVKKYGESYREGLEKLVRKLKLQKHVHFENRYLPLDEIVEHLRATDIYITPYLEPQQISSGTLAYAVGAGRPCISTSYLYAQEVLGQGRGILVPFKNSKVIAKKIIYLLEHPEARKKIEKKAYLYGRTMIWSNVALKYLDLFWFVAPEKKVETKNGADGSG